VFDAFGIEMIDLEGYEADDMIGTLVHNMPKNRIIIVSGDMDTMQLVEGERVVVYTAKRDTGKGFFYTEEEVYKKYGIYPKQIADYKGLRGDTSDNIPGIKGVGEKTAQILLEKFGSLDNLYAEIHKVVNGESNKTFKDFGVTERIFNLLKDGEDEAMFSRALATITLDAPVVIPDFKEYDFESHKESLLELCDKYGFTSIRKKLVGASAVDTKEKTEKNTDEKRDGFESFAISQSTWSELSLKKAQIAIWLLRSEEGGADEARIKYLTKKQDEYEAIAYLESELQKQGLYELYSKMELPLIHILEKMKSHGVMVDRDKLYEMLKSYDKKRQVVEDEIYTLAGEKFNLNSPKQLGEILYAKLAIGTKIKKTKGGKLSTRADVLEELKDEHEIIQKVLLFRELDKMINTYLEPLLNYSMADERIHSTFVQTGTTTGRFSSIDPNMQNIPVRGEEGKLLRNCFVASEGRVLLSADYSQIELRVAAMLSGDPYLKYIFDNNLDVHTIIAAKMFNVAETEVTKDMRRAAKAMNFGIIYGMGVNSIKQTLGVERKEAQQFYDAYTGTVSVLMDYLYSTVKFAKENGYTETLYGRRRNIIELGSNLPFIKAQGERIAMNAPIQGTDADIIKWAMVDFDTVIMEKGWQDRVHLILQIHDEILFEVDSDIAAEVGELLLKTMQEVMINHKPVAEYTEIPVVANVKMGTSWGEM
jgi:DNA polymerase-1